MISVSTPPFPSLSPFKIKSKGWLSCLSRSRGSEDRKSEVCSIFRRERPSTLGLDDGSEALGTGVLCAHEPLKALAGKQPFPLVPFTTCCVY